MKRTFFLLITFLLLTVVFICCNGEGTATSQISEIAQLTSEEIELIRRRGYNDDYVVRWPNGYIDVYDATGYSRMQEVLNQWNEIVDGAVYFRLSNNPNSSARIYFDSSTGGNDFDAPFSGIFWGKNKGEWYTWIVDAKWDNKNYTLSRVDLKIVPSSANDYSVFLYAFGAIVGFDTRPSDGNISNMPDISDKMKKMVPAFYKVLPGYCLAYGESEIEMEGSGKPYKCSGCWGGHTSYFDEFNVIDDDNSYAEIWPKNNEKLPDSINIILKGKKWIPEETRWDDSIETITSYNSMANGYEITKLNNQNIRIKLFKDNSSAFNTIPWKEVKLYVYKVPSGKLLGSYVFEDESGIFPRAYSWSNGGVANYGQCVWWATKRWVEEVGWKTLFPFYPPSPEKVNVRKIDKDYQPEEFDILINYDPTQAWKLGHYGFVEKVDKDKDEIYIIITQFNFIPEAYNYVERKWARKATDLYYSNNPSKEYYFKYYYRK